VGRELKIQVLQLNRTPVFRVVPGGIYGFNYQEIFGATKLSDGNYYFPAFYPLHRRVLRDLEIKTRANKAELILSDEALKHYDAMEAYQDKIDDKVLPSDFEFRTDPYEHQLDGLIHLIYNLRAALFYDCGLGKTKVIIDWQRAVKAWPIVLCPKIALHVWPNQLAMHGIDQEYMVVDGATPKKKKQQITEAKTHGGIVMTYDTMKRYYAQIVEEVPYDAIVADESHKLKGYDSMRTQVATEIGKKAYRRVIMSGTPSLGDPKDLPPQFRFLAMYIMPWNKTDFRRKFCNRASADPRIIVGYKNLDILNARANILSIRRRKEECLDLPERSFVDIPIKLSGKPLKLYNTLVVEVQQYGDLETIISKLVSDELVLPRGVIDIAHPAVLINKLLQVSSGFVMKKDQVPSPCDGCQYVDNCVEVEPQIRPWTKRCFAWNTSEETLREEERERMGPPPETFAERLGSNPKEEPFVELMEELMREDNHKVIVWGQFIEELNMIEDIVQKMLPDKGSYVRVDGRSMGKIQDFEKTFNENPNCRVYIGQVATAVAITLNVAQYMVYYSLPWNLEHYSQSLDRNHRIGQTKATTVYRLLTNGVEKYVAKALAEKSKLAESLVSADGVNDRNVKRTITKVHEL
jgi:SNF2 family DNA or RNA helicase